MPGGQCPYCKKMIKVERKGKQNCQNCGCRLDVEITDREMEGGDHGHKDFQVRTYIRKG
jgi:transcription initiation factor TFIIIB Brf1 subunit/transcription initiation factor TFIIB